MFEARNAIADLLDNRSLAEMRMLASAAAAELGFAVLAAWGPGGSPMTPTTKRSEAASAHRPGRRVGDGPMRGVRPQLSDEVVHFQ